MMERVRITLEGISGYSTCLVFEDEDLRLNLGGNTRCGSESRRVANMDLTKLGVYIVGGPEFVAEIEKCKTDDGEWNGPVLLALGFATMLSHFREHPDDFFKMLKEVEKDAFERGGDAARSVIRDALGIEGQHVRYASDGLDCDDMTYC